MGLKERVGLPVIMIMAKKKLRRKWFFLLFFFPSFFSFTVDTLLNLYETIWNCRNDDIKGFIFI